MKTIQSIREEIKTLKLDGESCVTDAVFNMNRHAHSDADFIRQLILHINGQEQIVRKYFKEQNKADDLSELNSWFEE
jgi:hypothetical protein